MSPVTHFLVGWMVGQCARLNPRERAWVSVAGVIPDVDGLGLVAEIATRNSSHPLLWWSDYHHVLGHNLAFGLAVTTAALLLARCRWICGCLIFLSFHLHLFCDLIGARGPDGYQWPIPYWMPFTREHAWVWAGQWPLNGWPNLMITAILIGLTLALARVRGHSALEIFSRRADAALVAALRARFPLK